MPGRPWIYGILKAELTMQRRLVFLTLLLTTSLVALAQGVRLGDPYKQVFATLRSGSYQEVVPGTDGGGQQIVTRRKENAAGKEVSIREYYGFTRSGLLKTIETHYFCSDEAWLKEFTLGMHKRFTSQWGQAQYDAQNNLYYWVTSSEGDLTMAGDRIDPQLRSKYFSILYTRQSLLSQ
jgi:hypothetical protein